MSFKRKLLDQKVWRLGGWMFSVFLAVATTIQLLGVLLSGIPTGLLVTNANIFLPTVDYAIEFRRSFGNFTFLIFIDLLVGLLTLMTWWFASRAWESLPYSGQVFTEKQRRQMVTQWHEVGIIFVIVGLVATVATLIQRLWLWSQVIAPELHENSVEFTEPGLSSIMFNDWGLLFSSPTLMLLSGVFTLIFFEKLEDEESIVVYEVEPQFYDYEEPPLTTGILALQAIPGSMKQMPRDLRSLPVRLFQRAVNFFQSMR